MNLKNVQSQPDRAEFINAMKLELNAYIKNKHWKVIPLKNIPKGRRCLPMAWAMKRKHNPLE